MRENHVTRSIVSSPARAAFLDRLRALPGGECAWRGLGRTCTAGGGASARCGPRRIPAGSGSARSTTAVPRNLPGLPPVRGRRGRMPAGSTPRSCGSPPDAAGRRDPPRAFPRTPKPGARAAARPHRRGRAEPLRGPAPRGRRVPPGLLPRHAPPASHRDEPPGRAAARRRPRLLAKPPPERRCPRRGFRRPEARAGASAARIPRSSSLRAAPRCRLPKRARFPRPGLAEPHPTRSRGRRLARAPAPPRQKAGRPNPSTGTGEVPVPTLAASQSAPPTFPPVSSDRPS